MLKSLQITAEHFTASYGKKARFFIYNSKRLHESEVVVYAKLPKGFLIPTPVGDYNPDWAIAFTAGAVRHIYFVAETKGSLSSMTLREIEHTKIECARKFFAEISQRMTKDQVKYDVVTNYAQLMDMVGCER